MIAAEQIAEIVNKLNRANDQRLPTMWELVILAALSESGRLRHEVRLPNGRQPDIELSVDGDQPLLIVGDVATITDIGVENANPLPALWEKLRQLTRKKGPDLNRFRVEVGRRQGKKGVEMALPEKSDLMKLMEAEINDWLHEIRKHPHQSSRFERNGPNVGFSIEYNPTQQFGLSSFPRVDLPSSPDGNQLFERLKRGKADQLRGAPESALRVVVACDGGAGLMEAVGTRPQPGSFDAQAIAAHFLAGSQSIDAIILVTVQSMGRTDRSKRFQNAVNLIAGPSPRLTEHARRQLEQIGALIREGLPIPVQSPRNASYRSLEPGCGRDPIGGYEMSGNRVTLSARAIQRLLGGEVTIEEFDSAHGWDDPRGPQNPFKRRLAEGRMIAEVTIEHGGDRDDDHITFRFGPVDAAIANFRVPAIVEKI